MIYDSYASKRYKTSQPAAPRQPRNLIPNVSRQPRFLTPKSAQKMKMTFDLPNFENFPPTLYQSLHLFFSTLLLTH
jgi:hypothetical protein